MLNMSEHSIAKQTQTLVEIIEKLEKIGIYVREAKYSSETEFKLDLTIWVNYPEFESKIQTISS